VLPIKAFPLPFVHHSIEVKADLNRDVLILTPVLLATAAAYLQHKRNFIYLQNVNQGTLNEHQPGM
jgi:hypothetical protein